MLVLLFVIILLSASVSYCQPIIIPVDSYPCALAFNSYPYYKVYCANQGSNTVSVINSNCQVIATVHVGDRPCALVYNDNNNKIYCANQASNDVTIINGVTDEVINTIQIGTRPNALVYNYVSNKIYCANANSNNVSIIDGANDNLITTVIVGLYPTAFTFNPISNKIYCANTDNESVSIIDGATDLVIATVPVGRTPISLAYSTWNNQVYCASWSNGRIDMIDGATNQKVDSLIYDNSGPQSLIATDYNRIAYVNFTGDNIKLINCATNTIMATYQFPAGTRPYALSATGNYLYCANVGSNNIAAFVKHNLNPTAAFENINYPVTLLSVNWRTYIANLWASTISLIIDPTAIDEQSVHELHPVTFTVYPNPARTFFTIRLPRFAERTEIKIYDVTGKMVKKQEFKSLRVSELRVSTQGLNQGVYFIRVDNLPKLKKIEVIK
jgi:YVTN family beta-propeller protein